MDILNKISVKNVVGPFDRPTEMVWLLRVAGIVSGVKQGEGVYGTWTSFLGDFRAINLSTGESYSSGRCFLPDCFGDLMSGMLDARTDDKGSIEFVVDIGVKPSSKAVGYEYVVKSLIEPASNSPIDVLLSRIQALSYDPTVKANAQYEEEVEDSPDHELKDAEEMLVEVFRAKPRRRK